MMTRRPLLITALFVAACSGDDVPGPSGATESSTGTPPTASGTGASSGSGSGGGASSGAEETGSLDTTSVGSTSTTGPAESSSGSGDDSSGSTGGLGPVFPDWADLQLEQSICDGASYYTPTVAGHDEVFAVGCVRDSGSSAPQLYFVSGTEGVLGQDDTLLARNGNPYLDVALTAWDGRFQASYQHRCTHLPTNSGCIDVRVYEGLGSRVNDETIFQNSNHNGHPVMAWSGSSYGVAWVSYDDVYFRRLDDSGNSTADGNVLVGPDPEQPDQRDGARTKIVYHPGLQEYAIFVISGYNLYRGRVSEAGDVLEAPTLIADQAYSQTFNGQFVAAALGDEDYLLYHDETNLVLARVFPEDGGMSQVVVQEGEYRFPSMVAYEDTLLVFRQNPETGFGEVLAYDPDLQALPELSGILGDGEPMIYPQGAVDRETGTFAVVYQDAEGSVLFRTIGGG
ncbi:MAG: hypothetical protein ACE37F_17125 [Nannocystaceae bacterium]|nr:hypothetical protein [bacterium]